MATTKKVSGTLARQRALLDKRASIAKMRDVIQTTRQKLVLAQTELKQMRKTK